MSIIGPLALIAGLLLSVLALPAWCWLIPGGGIDKLIAQFPSLRFTFVPVSLALIVILILFAPEA